MSTEDLARRYVTAYEEWQDLKAQHARLLAATDEQCETLRESETAFSPGHRCFRAPGYSHLANPYNPEESRDAILCPACHETAAHLELVHAAARRKGARHAALVRALATQRRLPLVATREGER